MAEKTVRRLTIRLMMVLVAVAAGIAWGFSLQFGKDLRIAADNQHDVETRKEAVARLSQEDQQKLNRYLTDRLPGDWDLVNWGGPGHAHGSPPAPSRFR